MFQENQYSNLPINFSKRGVGTQTHKMGNPETGAITTSGIYISTSQIYPKSSTTATSNATAIIFGF